MGDLMNMLASKAEELEGGALEKEKKENELKRERLQLAKNLLKEGDAGGSKGKRSSKGSGSSSPSSSERKSKGSAPPTPSRDNRKSIQTSTDGAGAFPGIAFHTEADGPATGKNSIRKSPAVSRKSEEKSMEKSQSDNEDHEPKKKKKGKKDKVDAEEQARLEQEEAEREEQERLQREQEEAEREEKRLAEKARKKAERKERKRKEKEQRAKEEAEREEKARENKEELERLEREEFEREQKEREERERLERERIEREDREEEERERKRKEAEAAGQKKPDEEDLDMIKGEIWEGFFQEGSNILDKTMSRASAAFYQELKGGAATLLNDPGSPIPGGRPVGRLPPNAGPPPRQSQTVRVNQSERAIGKINASQWENRPKEAPAAPRSTAPVPVSKGSVMEKAKFLQDHKETGLETKSKSEVVVPRKLTNTGVLANLEQKLQPTGPKLPPRQASAPVLPLGGSGGIKPAPPVGGNKPTLPASAPSSPAPGGGSGIAGSPPPPPGGVVQDITPLEYQTAADTGKTIVVAGSLPSLINKLVSDKDDEEGFDRDLFVNTFLVVHPLLLSSTELLKNLKDIYALYCNKPIIKTNKASLPPHVRTLQVVNHWASNFTDNFVIADDGAVRRAFFNWVEDLRVQRENEKKDKKKKKKWKLIDLEPLLATVAFVKGEAKKVKEQRKQDKAYYKKKRAYKEKKKMARNGAALPEKPVPLPEEVRTSIVKEYSAKELAQQLTYADYTLFKKIRNSELFNQNWTKHKERSPNLVAMIRWFNEISMWTMSQIVCIPDEKERTAALRKFIEIGKEMKNLNNYNGIMLILSALNNTAVRRLKSNWEALPKSVRGTFMSLQEILNPDENFGNLRTAMRNAEPPVIPFMGLYLTQMTYIDENDDKKDGLVNFNKMHLFGKVLLELKRFQSADYPFKPIPSVQNYLLNKLEFPDLTTSSKSKRLPKGYGKMKWWGEKEVYQQSQLVKPRDENA